MARPIFSYFPALSPRIQPLLLLPFVLWGCGIAPGRNGDFVTEECTPGETCGEGDGDSIAGDGDSGDGDGGDTGDGDGAPGSGGMMQGSGGMMQGSGGMMQGTGGMMQGAGGMIMPGMGGMMPGTGGVGSSDCGTCNAGTVCCSGELPCAGMCVPDCRTASACPDALICDEVSGVCVPEGTMGTGGMPMGGSI